VVASVLAAILFGLAAALGAGAKHVQPLAAIADQAGVGAMLGDDEIGGIYGKGIGEEFRNRDIAFRIDVAERAAMEETWSSVPDSLRHGRSAARIRSCKERVWTGRATLTFRVRFGALQSLPLR
jgi:hypothetical protein